MRVVLKASTLRELLVTKSDPHQVPTFMLRGEMFRAARMLPNRPERGMVTLELERAEVIGSVRAIITLRPRHLQMDDAAVYKNGRKLSL